MSNTPLQIWTQLNEPWMKMFAAPPNVAALTGSAAAEPAKVTSGNGSTALPTLAGAGAPPVNALTDYLVDSMQRTILFWDVLRKRGNQALEHRASGKPPVLRFPYEVVLDGKTLERPVNYQLLRITPPADAEMNPKARPFIVFDPRAGHGPGIGGFKEASQVGVAMQDGHPVYLVSFLPEPVPGQTIEDIARAEVQFVEKVVELHPEAESSPAIVGNCQGGWGLMLMASLAPELPGVISIAGSPLSYWAGERGKNPMRYTGGLAGGSWLASFTGDLGNGIFDGSYLVSNFETLNPSNSLWSKNYNLYANVDTEEGRFLEFERWWSGHFYMTVEEMRFIVDNLFVGNKLAKGDLVFADGHRVDLREIKAPIVVIASWGDNITPPQQALNWILDLYDSIDEMRARRQTIVYTVHPSIGHLGIFVSAKVAMKEHAEFVGALDMIEVLPPGLYEMVIEDETLEQAGSDEEHSSYVVRLEARDLDAIRQLDDGRDDERAFETVARVSEINEGLYERFARPWVKAMTNEATAEMLRAMQPVRLERLFWSDMNPGIAWVKAAAEMVKQQRRPVADDNPFKVLEAANSEQIVAALDRYRDARDSMQEKLFFGIWESPLAEAMAGMAAPHSSARQAHSRPQAYGEWIELKLKALYEESQPGDFAEAVYRIGFACLEAGKVQDARAYRMTRKIAKEDPRMRDLTRREVKEKARRAAFIVQFDPEGALETLPKLLPDPADRADALDVIKRIVSWRPDIAPEHAAVIEKVEAIFAGEHRPAPRPSRRRSAA